VFVDVISVDRMAVSIVKIVFVDAVLDHSVAAA